MIYLYLKIHNKTGLKYLGKTTKDPNVYKGSGVYWLNHLKIHGYDVTTHILKECINNEQCKFWGKYYSDLYDVVSSSDFANLIEETGTGGVPTNAFKPGHTPWSKGKKLPSVSESKTEYWKKWRERNPNYKDEWNRYTKVSEERKEELKKLHSTNCITKNTQELTCPHCGKSGKGVANMKRWHFDNCKNKL